MIKKILSTTAILAGAVVLTGCSKDDSEGEAIKVYTRDTSSGTRDGFFSTIDFEEAVKSNEELVDGYVEVDGNGSMITAVKNDEFGLGYISLSSYATSGLNGLTYDGVEATEANVINKSYELTRNFNYMTRVYDDYSDTEEAIVKAYVAFLSTTDGLATIKANDGIVDIPASAKSWDDIKADYAIPEDASSTTIKFGGSTSVEKIAKALSAQFSQLFGNFKVEHNHTGSSDAYKRLQGDESTGANKIHVGFASREFKTAETVNKTTSTIGTICVDAIVAVVNSKNKNYTGTDAADLKDIYSGEVTMWSELQ